MSLVSKARSMATVLMKPSLASVGSSDYLFIVSHMRSRSSVLAHILGSNERVCGYSELGISYRGRVDLIKMRAKLEGDLHCDLRGKYLLDKVLHNNFELSERVLEATGAKLLFLLREPESTVASIWNGQLTLRKPGEAPGGTPEYWYNYYCNRVRYMQQLAEKTRGHWFFVEADELVDDTAGTLDRLTDWLGLQEPLAPEYDLFPNTGKLGHGDWSDNIRSGKLAKTESNPAVQVADAVRQEAMACYESCKAALR